MIKNGFWESNQEIRTVLFTIKTASSQNTVTTYGKFYLLSFTNSISETCSCERQKEKTPKAELRNNEFVRQLLQEQIRYYRLAFNDIWNCGHIIKDKRTQIGITMTNKRPHFVAIQNIVK